LRLSLTAFRSGIGMKLALVGLLLLAPLFVTTAALIEDWSDDVGVAIGTRDGLEFVAGLRALIDPLTAHRGATTLALAHEPGSEKRAIGLEQKVDEVLTKMRGTEAGLGRRFGAEAAVARIAAEWERVERDWRSMSIDQDRAAHSAIAEAILSLNETVGTAANFPIDREAESHYLLDAVGLRLLSIANLTGWMRSQLAAAAVAGTLSGTDRDRLVSAYERTRGLMDLVDADLAKALGLKDARIAPIADVYRRYQARAREFRTLTEAMLAAPKIAAQPDYVMKIGGDAKSAAFDLYDSAHRTALRVIDDRIKTIYRSVIGTLSLTLTLTLLALSFAGRLRGQIARQLSSARAAFVRMEDGDFDAPLVPESRDEAGDVVAALARMQHALKARIERDAVLAAVADYADSAVMITDAEGRITWLNAGFTRMTGRSPDGALGRTPEHLLDRRAADPAACARIEAARAQGLGWREDLRCVAADGREYFIHAVVGSTRRDQGLHPDRDRRDRAAARRRSAARRARRGGGRQPRQECLPRQHEPRDPHAPQRRDRHDRAAARHAARRPAA
jgi:PAS domain S-box-containing protein